MRIPHKMAIQFIISLSSQYFAEHCTAAHMKLTVNIGERAVRVRVVVSRAVRLVAVHPFFEIKRHLTLQ